jgi:cysteine desulfurase
VFTSGGTESDNLAVQGTYAARRDADPRRVRVLAGSVEHHAVLDCVDFLAAHEGAKVNLLDSDGQGRIAPETVRSALAVDRDAAALVSVMWANNEVGTIQDIAGIASVAKEFGFRSTPTRYRRSATCRSTSLRPVSTSHPSAPTSSVVRSGSAPRRQA